jgi:hypothetical protein
MSPPFSCSTSSGEIDRLSFPFIDLYVPGLTPRIHCSESALQLAENTTFVFLCHVNTGIVPEYSNKSYRCDAGIIYIYCMYVRRLYNAGARTEP